MKSYKIGIKLLGLYFILTGISMIPSMLMLAISSLGELGIIKFTFLTLPVFTILAGLFIFLKTDALAMKSQSDFEQSDSIDGKLYFSSGIQLLGVYFFISHFGDAFTDALMIITHNPRDEKTLFDTQFYTNIFIAFLGLSLIFKAKALAKYINETTK